jgi:hypothetical protein
LKIDAMGSQPNSHHSAICLLYFVYKWFQFFVNNNARSGVFPIRFPWLDITAEEDNEITMSPNIGGINLGFCQK